MDMEEASDMVYTETNADDRYDTLAKFDHEILITLLHQMMEKWYIKLTFLILTYLG